jgi:alkanesulfonate monooxygenase SsuD/methylene tetrahydromethanopterin reductase-like flavin-dependent oxidoreductase (luciferase family)
MKVEFGVVDHLDRQNRPIHETFDSRLELMKLYDRAGFSTFHLTEHHFTPLGLAPSPLIFLSAASRITERIRFAPLVLILSLYNPLRLAAEICMLDHLTKGRLDVGVGRGISPYELAYYNVSSLETPEIFLETYDVLMRALTQETVDFRGSYFKYFNVPIELRPYQQPHPPMWYATGNPKSVIWAAQRNMNVAFLFPAERARPLIDLYKATWQEAHGGSGATMPRIGITRHIYIGDSDAEADERGSFGYQGWYEKFAYLWQKTDPRPPASFEEVRRRNGSVLLFGTADTVRRRVAEELERSGATYFIARFAYGDLTHEESVRSLDRFAREVMPAFQVG